MKLILDFLIVCFALLGPTVTAGSHYSVDAEEKIAAFYKHVPPKEKLGPQETSRTLQMEAMHGDIPFGKLLTAVTEARDSSNPAYISALAQVKAIHEARTFRARYGDHYRYVKAIDYEQKLCDMIDAAILSLQKVARKK